MLGLAQRNSAALPGAEVAEKSRSPAFKASVSDSASSSLDQDEGDEREAGANEGVAEKGVADSAEVRKALQLLKAPEVLEGLFNNGHATRIAAGTVLDETAHAYYAHSNIPGVKKTVDLLLMTADYARIKYNANKLTSTQLLDSYRGDKVFGRQVEFLTRYTDMILQHDVDEVWEAMVRTAHADLPVRLTAQELRSRGLCVVQKVAPGEWAGEDVAMLRAALVELAATGLPRGYRGTKDYIARCTFAGRIRAKDVARMIFALGRK